MTTDVVQSIFLIINYTSQICIAVQAPSTGVIRVFSCGQKKMQFVMLFQSEEDAFHRDALKPLTLHDRRALVDSLFIAGTDFI